MKRYLLFDAGCAVCNQIAQAIEEAASGKLQAVSLRDPQAVQWLEQVYPEGWAYRPYLVTVDGDRVQAYAGPGMAMRLGWLLGPRKLIHPIPRFPHYSGRGPICHCRAWSRFAKWSCGVMPRARRGTYWGSTQWL